MTDSDPQSSRDLHRRLNDIESLVTFLQRTIDDLNAVILEQQRRLESQDKELGLLRTAFSTLTDSIVEVPRRPEDEKPPHY
jgi:SlyX protein